MCIYDCMWNPTARLLITRFLYYIIPLCVAFVDYENAFDSVQTQAILSSLQEQGKEDVYREILKDIYGQLSDSTSAQRE